MTTLKTRAAVKEGRVLGTDVLGAVLARTQPINDAFVKMGDNMERAGTRLENSFNRALASIDSKIGLSKSLTGLFNVISSSLDQGIGQSLSALATGGTAGLAANLAANSTSATPSRPRVGRAGQLAPVRVTADAPGRGRRGGGRGSRPEGPGANTTLPLGGSTFTGALENLAAAGDAGRSRSQLSGVGAGIGDSVALIGANLEQQFGPLQERLATLGAGVGQTLVDSLANGITAAVQSGNIGDGFKEMGKTLLGGLGAAVRDFGIQSLGIAKLMGFLRGALASFNPVASAAASIGLIAAGSALVGLAGRGARQSFGTTNTGINRGAASSSTIIERGSIGLPSSIYTPQSGGGSASGAVASASSPVLVNATIIGYNDPRAQRDIAELIKRGAARGSA